MNTTKHTVEQGQALVRSIEALETIEHANRLERPLVRLLLQASRRQQRALLQAAPDSVAEETLGASEAAAFGFEGTDRG